MKVKSYIKQNVIYLLLLLIFFFNFYCNKEEQDNKSFHTKLEEAELKFENVSFVKGYKDCQPTSPNCTYILFDYAKISEGNFKDEINSSINDEIIKISNQFLEGSKSKSIEEVSELFLRDYSNFISKNPKSETIWMMEVRGKVENYTPKILCYSISNVNFLGGAHPNTMFRYINFDRKTGKVISLNDIFTVGFESKLNTILDRVIRQNYMLKPEDDLRDKVGLFENKIEFNNNFAITKHGIKFYYNPYEIAPYSVGFIELIVPYSALEEILPLNSKARP
ncbi:MAG: DUF3298 and DUF4163 domain-containing protein [Ignavibacteria bacterium]|nr:DUF3298 and DUF4163 domain-containing protein [Ignavibacteria bacterium]